MKRLEARISDMGDELHTAVMDRIKARNERDATKTEVERLREALQPFATFISMVEAHLECSDQEPLKDSDVVLSFMGSGASDRVSVGEFRAARAALAEGGVT